MLSLLRLLFLFFAVTAAATVDRAPNGLSLAEIAGYERWEVLAPSSRTDKNEIRLILANPAAASHLAVTKSGGEGPFPDGSIIVKIAFSQKPNPRFPAALEPDVLQRVEFMVKDASRFSSSNGWGYARFVYDASSDRFTPYGSSPSFQNECHGCHTVVKDRDFVFTKSRIRR